MSTHKDEVKVNIEKTVTFAFNEKKRSIKAIAPISDSDKVKTKDKANYSALEVLVMQRLYLNRAKKYDIDMLPDEPVIKVTHADKVAARNQP